MSTIAWISIAFSAVIVLLVYSAGLVIVSQRRRIEYLSLACREAGAKHRAAEQRLERRIENLRNALETV